VIALTWSLVTALVTTKSCHYPTVLVVVSGFHVVVLVVVAYLLASIAQTPASSWHTGKGMTNFDENKRKFTADIERLKALKDSSVTDNGNANCVVCGCGFFVKRAGHLLPETQASQCCRIIGR